MIRLLLVDDEKDFRHSLAEELRRGSYEVFECASADSAMATLERDPYAVIVMDLRLSGVNGIDLLGEARRRNPEATVVVLTAPGSIEGAVVALRSGAQDYLVKPVAVAALRQKVDLLLRHRGSPLQERSVRPSTPGGAVPTGLVGTSRAIRDLELLIRKVASTDSTVLVSGETGTGKEVVARAIHSNSPRRDRPFVAINCSAIPEALLESQLFGHVRGAFTSADRDRQGFFETAAGGTILLDEIGEMPIGLQPKILRALDTREFLPLGSTKALAVGARIIAATNRDLKAMVASGQFREDLYFRLSTFEIPIAPLRTRIEDIAVTAEYLLSRTAQATGRTAPRLGPAALLALEQYPWPGNVRELANVLERAMILSQGPAIEPVDLPRSLAPASLAPATNLRTARRNFELLFVKRMVEASGGDKILAAKTLGISLTSLYRKLDLPLRTARKPD